MIVFASHNNDLSIRRSSSSGGVFSILAEKVLKDGGVVYGAAFDDDWQVAHRRVDSLDGIPALRSSKYAYSRIGSAINDALADLQSGRRVLFSGTPCQVAAMAKRAEGMADNLLLVEVVCHGAPKPEYWNKYLDELCDKLHESRSSIRSINFRDKVTGWKDYSFTITFADGKTFAHGHTSNPYIYAFIKNFTLRDACFRCPFKHPNSKADISIGDLWGIEHIAPEIDNDLGTTSVICHTDKGVQYSADIPVLKKLTFDAIAAHNKALLSSPGKSPDFESFNDMAKTRFHKACSKYASMPLKHRILNQISKLIVKIKR